MLEKVEKDVTQNDARRMENQTKPAVRKSLKNWQEHRSQNIPLIVTVMNEKHENLQNVQTRNTRQKLLRQLTKPKVLK